MMLGKSAGATDRRARCARSEVRGSGFEVPKTSNLELRTSNPHPSRQSRSVIWNDIA